MRFDRVKYVVTRLKDILLPSDSHLHPAFKTVIELLSLVGNSSGIDPA